jgi:hypothetical protein
LEALIHVHGTHSPYGVGARLYFGIITTG